MSVVTLEGINISYTCPNPNPAIDCKIFEKRFDLIFI